MCDQPLIIIVNNEAINLNRISNATLNKNSGCVCLYDKMDSENPVTIHQPMAGPLWDLIKNLATVIIPEDLSNIPEG